MRPATGGNDLTNSEPAPPAVGPTPQSQVDEIQSLKAQLECHKKDGIPLANPDQPQVLLSDQDTVDHMKAATTPLKDNGKKLILSVVMCRAWLSLSRLRLLYMVSQALVAGSGSAQA